MARFLHLGFNFYQRPMPEALPTVIDTAKDWMKYSSTAWIIWTNLSPADWYAKIKPILHKDDSFLIVEVNLSLRNGWLPKNLVDWFNKNRAIDRPGL